MRISLKINNYGIAASIALSLLTPLLVSAEGTSRLDKNPHVDSATLTNESLKLAEQGRFVVIESQLNSINPHPAQTAEWFLETATNLLRLAFTAKERGDMPTAEKIASRAARYAMRAKAAAKDNPSILAQVANLQTVIGERFLTNSSEVVSERAEAKKQEQEALRRAGNK